MPSQNFPVLTNTIQATATLTANRFADVDGSLPSAGGKPHGVCLSGAVSGESVGVVVSGTAIIETSAAIAQGAEVQTGADGRIATQSSTNSTVGVALEAASGAGEFIEVELFKLNN